MSRNKVIFDVLANSSQYKAQMKGIEKTTNETSRSVKAAFAVSSAAIAGTLAAYAKYQTQLIKVGKTADISGKELSAFGKDVVALSAKIPLSTNELLELAASAAQLGVKGKDNILKFTETVAKLGTATNITGEEGAQAIARLLNVTGEGVGTVDRFAAIITRLGNNVAASESEILSMASRVGKATAQFDLGTTAVLGISAALKEVGVEAELGGSSIGRTFLEIQNAVFEGGEAMETFSNITGKSGEEIKKIFKEDATQAFKIFIEALGKLPAEQVSSSMASMGLEGTRLREVIGTLAKRSELLGKNLALASDEAKKQTALNQEFQTAVVSLENSFKFMRQEIVNLAASMGKDLAPAAKELMDDITGIIRGIRTFNEVTGGAITTSLVMAAKVAALSIAVNKLKSVLLMTGIFSGKLATQLGVASVATARYSSLAAYGAVKNRAFALSFATVGTASRSALMAIKSFQVGLGAMIGGLIIAIDLGLKLGEVLGKMGELTTSEQDLAKNQSQLNNLLAIRVRLQDKVNNGDKGAQERLDKLDKEIAKRKGLITVIQREVDARASKKTTAPELEGIVVPPEQVPGAPGDAGGSVYSTEDMKTALQAENVALRIAAAQREAETLAQIEQGMSDESIRLAQERNNQLGEIDQKKAELDRLNLDLSRAGINSNEQQILESKRSAAEQELAILEEKFAATQEKTAEQDAIDKETRIAAKQMLNQALTEQELLFLEEQKVRKTEDREEDIELKTVQAEEDLLFLQNQLITKKQAEDEVRMDRMKKDAARRNQEMKNEAKYGKTIGGLHNFFQNEQMQGVKSTLGMISQIKTKDGNAAGKAVKAFAMAEAAIKIPTSAINAYTSMVGIPYVGPILAPIAAAAAVAIGTQNLNQIRSKKSPSYAVGTDFVPNDMMANIHAGEAIIPAKQNQFLQSGDLVLGNPDSLSNNSDSEPQNIVNINFDGANFTGNVGDNDEFINQVFDGIATGINEGRLAGFESATLSVTG